MPNLKDIRRRIGSVRKTQQITRAMRMVAAAKLRRAQNAVLAARSYAAGMRDTLAEVAGVQLEVEPPLLERRDPIRRVEFLIVTGDRGLCGAFNANVIKAAEAEIRERAAGLEGFWLTLVGGKGAE